MRACGVEVFVFDFAEGAAVDGICVIRSKAGDIKMICPSTDFFVRREAYFNGAVRLAGGYCGSDD